MNTESAQVNVNATVWLEIIHSILPVSIRLNRGVHLHQLTCDQISNVFKIKFILQAV